MTLAENSENLPACRDVSDKLNCFASIVVTQVACNFRPIMIPGKTIMDPNDALSVQDWLGPDSQIDVFRWRKRR